MSEATKPRNKGGRPPAGDAARTLRVMVRMSPAERAEAERQAKALGLSLAAYLRGDR